MKQIILFVVASFFLHACTVDDFDEIGSILSFDNEFTVQQVILNDTVDISENFDGATFKIGEDGAYFPVPVGDFNDADLTYKMTVMEISKRLSTTEHKLKENPNSDVEFWLKKMDYNQGVLTFITSYKGNIYYFKAIETKRLN